MTTAIAASFAEIPMLSGAVVAIGTFDGMHRGHQYLLGQARDRARSGGYPFVVLTFDPNPQLVLRPNVRHFELTPAAIKLDVLKSTVTPDLIVLLPFTAELAATSADDFMAALQSRVHLREMWMGHDFAFGHKRSGNVAYLIEHGQTDGFAVHVISRVDWHGETASSTRIRQALADGDIALANDLLGRPLRLRGSSRAIIPMERDREGEQVTRPDAVGFWCPLRQALPAAGHYTVTLTAGPSAPEGGVMRDSPAMLTVPSEPLEVGDLCRLELSAPSGALQGSLSDGYLDVDVLARLDDPEMWRPIDPPLAHGRTMAARGDVVGDGA